MPPAWLEDWGRGRNWKRLAAALAARGLAVTDVELAEAMNRAFDALQVESCLPGLMLTSAPVELAATESGYKLLVSVLLAGGDGRLPPGRVPTRLAALSVAINEIARKKAAAAYQLNPGDRIGLGSDAAFDPMIDAHPLRRLGLDLRLEDAV